MRNIKETESKKKMRSILYGAALIALTASVVMTGCGKKQKTEAPDTDIIDVFTDDTTETPEETETAAETEQAVEHPAPTAAHGSAFSFAEANDPAKPQYVNPLTGLECTSDLSTKRPVAIMINNIWQAMPQIGISKADIIYECLAEGGITRLVMVTRDYENLETVGSVRSSREYFIDFAKNHDSIYIHAGGSEEAYSQISSRGIDHLDGVRADARTGKNMAGTVFYRDPERLKTMSLEHTMVTTGERLAKGIAEMGYNTEVRADFKDPIVPVDWGWDVVLSGDETTYVQVPYYPSRTAEYEYDAESGKYLRYQFNHIKHIDGTTGEQLAFDNIIILNVPHENRGDSYGHLNVATTGEGNGWYITGGKRIPIKWAKETQDKEMTLTDTEGYPLVVNRGKTIINITGNDVFSSLSFK